MVLTTLCLHRESLVLPWGKCKLHKYLVLPIITYGAANSDDYLPVMKDGETECLSLCVSSKVCLKSKGVNGRYEGFDGVEW